MGTQVSYGDYAILVLQGLNAPVTKNNVDKLVAIFKQESTQATFNPAAWSIHVPGDSDFNGIVRNYPDLLTGVNTTVQGMSQANTAQMTMNLKTNGSFADFISATNQFYGSWGGGPISVDQATADKAAESTLVPGTVDAYHQTLADAASALGVQIGMGDPGAAINVTPGIPNPLDAISSVVDFLKHVWSALTSRANWIRVGLVLGAILLAIFGMLTISKSFGGPGATDVAKGAAIATV